MLVLDSTEYVEMQIEYKNTFKQLNSSKTKYSPASSIILAEYSVVSFGGFPLQYLFNSFAYCSSTSSLFHFITISTYSVLQPEQDNSSSTLFTTSSLRLLASATI